jgi:hypothetical protein
VQAGEVCLLDDGAVRLLGGIPADDATAESDLRELLGGLLSSASSSTAGLQRARRRAAGAGVGALLRELERALIPVNRAAARRALARLARETIRAKDEGRLTMAPEAPAVVERSAPVVVAVTPPPVVVAVEADPGLTQLLPRVEVTERLELPVVVAPVVVAPVVASPEEGETRPEPVVLRASQRPPAMPEPPSAVPPPVRELAPTGNTPVLGTVVAPSLIAEEPRLSVAELALSLATPEPAAADELELDVEVTFSEDEHTMTPEDVELILLAQDGAELERTEPCPSPLSESLPPPAVATAVDVELPAELLASAPSASEWVEAPEVGTVLPPWVTSRPEEQELSPPPRVAVPSPRESNVDDLLDRMESEAVGVEELRSGLKGLAGLEPTPPPPGSLSGD